jgi:ABC-type uncharacterized transport system substrate-binding protein
VAGFWFKIRHFSTLRLSTLSAALFLLVLLLFSSTSHAAKVLIVGDSKYPMVVEAFSDIKASLQVDAREYESSEVKGNLREFVTDEGAEVVVALGMDAIIEALRLPSSIAVVYGMVVTPPKINRTNVTGVYLSPPVSEYVSTVRNYLPVLSRLSVVGTHATAKSLAGGNSSNISIHNVGNSSELVNTVNRLTDARAVILLPDVNLLTAPAMSSIYLFSFKNRIPLLGISEAHVKQGSLFALVFDAKTVNRQIGEKVQKILSGTDADDIPASPPRKYNLYINNSTAGKMGITIPDEMLKKAKRVY